MFLFSDKLTLLPMTGIENNSSLPFFLTVITGVDHAFGARLHHENHVALVSGFLCGQVIGQRSGCSMFVKSFAATFILQGIVSKDGNDFSISAKPHRGIENYTGHQ